MKNVKCFALTAMFLAIAVLMVGCKPQGSDKPATYKVTGTVTLDGAAVSGATVAFVPAGSGTSASGTTDASGKYEMSTFEKGDGAVPGDYGVTISKFEYPKAAAAGGSGEYQGGDADSDQGAKNVLPEKYASQATSGFTAKVEAKEGSFDFALVGGAAPAASAAPKEESPAPQQ